MRAPRVSSAVIGEARAVPSITVQVPVSRAVTARLVERRVPKPVASLLLIGHNPGLHELALDLASTGAERERLEEKFPTAALATLALETTWSRAAPSGATLTAYVVPKQLR